ncbi:hypothetical protein [Antarcticimicrobium luteum]|uniref:DUF4435 domain-containing protein n=1 Tax=Antarcticimicrobium luteum TaxID=2547397 RepID=A0A4R5VE89_9RHOB|nr:hypothetical protein [Antarcticimicrobium luteum]TDK50709.1 hypothetical protein E1832_05795 [Antarcticimicrobium luteum]
MEGDIDVEYFDILKSKYPKIYSIPEDVEVVSYGGKDALKNTQVLQFMLSRLERVFITFDLDAEREVKPKLESIGLSADKDFCSIGIDQHGSECIEGLLPAAILAEVYAENVKDVAALGSANSSARRSAKSNLKRAALEKFKRGDLTDNDLKEMQKLMTKISKTF